MERLRTESLIIETPPSFSYRGMTIIAHPTRIYSVIEPRILIFDLPTTATSFSVLLTGNDKKSFI
jgi:hypothetical protein